MAEKEFDAFLTTDKGIPHQQNLADIGPEDRLAAREEQRLR